MHVTYGFVFYFTLFMFFLTACLGILAIRAVRRLFFGFTKKTTIFHSMVFHGILAISFIVITVILADSVLTYYSLSRNLQKSKYAFYQSHQ